MDKGSSCFDLFKNLDWHKTFNDLSAISTVLLLVFTIIGFIYIKKQISLAKNKDIFFNLQQNLESELNYFVKKNFDFMSECDELINDLIRKKPIVDRLH